MTTNGCCLAWIVPSSGIEIWKSLSSSSRKASYSSSERSISSLRSIGVTRDEAGITEPHLHEDGPDQRTITDITLLPQPLDDGLDRVRRCRSHETKAYGFAEPSRGRGTVRPHGQIPDGRRKARLRRAV